MDLMLWREKLAVLQSLGTTEPCGRGCALKGCMLIWGKGSSAVSALCSSLLMSLAVTRVIRTGEATQKSHKTFIFLVKIGSAHCFFSFSGFSPAW